MANYKTPKTLISEFLEGQKTQTAQGQRHREVLVRTPDDSVNSSVNQVRSPVRSPARGGRSPGRVVKVITTQSVVFMLRISQKKQE